MMLMANLSSLLLLTLLLCVSTTAEAFVGSNSRRNSVSSSLRLLREPDATSNMGILRQPRRRHGNYFGTTTKTRTTSSSSTTTSLYVFERMSEDCIGAIVSAQKQAQKLQRPSVDVAFLVAGIVDLPETSAMARTLKQYRITWRDTIRVLESMYTPETGSDGNNGGNTGFFNAVRNNKGKDGELDLPFSKELQSTLKLSGKLADQMKSTTINTHHLFLAMLQYDPGNQQSKMFSTDASAVTDPTTNGAYQVIVTIIDGKTQAEPTVPALDICETLLKHLNSNDDSGSSAKKERDLVTGVGGDGIETKTLEECGVDLTQQAQDGLLDPVYGRDNEIRSCIRTLVRRRKNNVCLIGEAGVGKTSIVEGIAQVLAEMDTTEFDDDDDSPLMNVASAMPCPPRLKGTRVVSLELANLVAGTKYRGEFEERLQSIIKEVTHPKAPPTILFIDEIHNLVGAGAAEGGMDAANLLKPALARGQLQVIGATTISEYRKYIEKDAALERRLQPIMVVEPSVDETYNILKAIASNYEQHHNVKYTTDSLYAAAKLSERYLTDRFLPDKVRYVLKLTVWLVFGFHDLLFSLTKSGFRPNNRLVCV